MNEINLSYDFSHNQNTLFNIAIYIPEGMILFNNVHFNKEVCLSGYSCESHSDAEINNLQKNIFSD